jgi:S1-C subfamily serine protease
VATLVAGLVLLLLVMVMVTPILSVAPAEMPEVVLPTAAETGRVAATAADGTVKVVARRCGVVSTGSGVLVAPDLVLTSAHVLGDLPDVVVEDSRGEHPASVAVRDAAMDVAVLRAEGLTGTPLPLRTGPPEQAMKGVVLGYPHGGPLLSVPAAVRDTAPMFVPDTPVHPRFIRSAVQIQAYVERGNSGGPFVGLQGDVLGVVFSQAKFLAGVSYALRSDRLIPYVEEARRRPSVVPTPRRSAC